MDFVCLLSKRCPVQALWYAQLPYIKWLWVDHLAVVFVICRISDFDIWPGIGEELYAFLGCLKHSVFVDFIDWKGFGPRHLPVDNGVFFHHCLEAEIQRFPREPFWIPWCPIAVIMYVCIFLKALIGFTFVYILGVWSCLRPYTSTNEKLLGTPESNVLQSVKFSFSSWFLKNYPLTARRNVYQNNFWSWGVESFVWEFRCLKSMEDIVE